MFLVKRTSFVLDKGTRMRTRVFTFLFADVPADDKIHLQGWVHGVLCHTRRRALHTSEYQVSMEIKCCYSC